MRFKEVKDPVHMHLETVVPVRATGGSAGYDFRTKEPIVLGAGETVLTFSDVKCELAPDEVLLLFIRSSVGVKQQLMLANGTGVIDADYFENEDNDGNIGLPLHNYGKETVYIPQGTRVAQGIIVKYTAEDHVTARRTGGFGSTGGN